MTPGAGAESAPAVAGVVAKDGQPHGYDFAGIVIKDEYRPVVDHFAAEVGKYGLRQEVASTAVTAFLDELQHDYGDSAGTRTTKYNVEPFGFPPNDPMLTRFLNKMADTGASEEEVWACLRYYKDIEALASKHEGRLAVHDRALAAEADKIIDGHRAEAEKAMRTEWGPHYEANIIALNRWLDGLPEAERVKIEQQVDEDGRSALNTPARLREFLALARSRVGSAAASTSPALAPAALPTDKAGIEARIAELEKLMRTDRRAYNKREGEYRELLAARERGTK